jgi:hypothetical protein
MRNVRLGPFQVLAAALVAVLLSGTIAVVGHLSGFDALERVRPTPSAYPDVAAEELERRLSLLYCIVHPDRDPALSTSLRIDGCLLVVTYDFGRGVCDNPDRSFWLREWTYDLRLLETAPSFEMVATRWPRSPSTLEATPSVEIEPMSYEGMTADVVTIPVNETAARRIESASERWSGYVRALTRGAPGDGSDLAGRMERLRAYARTELDDRLWERFAETVRYCAWGDVTGPPNGVHGDVRLHAAPGRGREFRDLLHAYKVARCPFDPGLLGP